MVYPWMLHNNSLFLQLLSLNYEELPSLLIYFLFPFFVVITLMGTFFTVQIKRYTPQCLPEDFEMWFLDLWMLLSYAWMVLQGILCVLFVLSEMRLRDARTAAGMLITADTERLWGASAGSNLVEELMNVSTYPSDPWQSGHVGLAPADIARLPVKIYGEFSSTSTAPTCC